MVAVAHLIPDDPREKESVLEVLRAHPELEDFIARVTAKAEDVFPEHEVTIDTVRYDEWDPLVRMIVTVPLPWDDFWAASDIFTSWVGRLPDYDRDLILVMPLWTGPMESYHR